MHSRYRLSLNLVIASMCLNTMVWGQASQPTATAPAAGPGKDAESGKKEALTGSVEKASVTEDSVAIRGVQVPYRATAALMQMRDEAGKTKASMFFVAYEKTEGRRDPNMKEGGPDARPPKDDPDGETTRHRPITFVFNGGPGAAAVWLHLGTAGPRRIELDADGMTLPPPFRLIPNEHSWLDATDMVFIDPVGTGFSRPAEGEKAEQFYGVTEDIRSVSEFIRLYLTLYKRWNSPQFIAGESYGTTRAAGLSEHLLDRYGIAVNGIMLISSVLNFQTLRFNDGNDLPYVLYLPSYAAIAWHHKRLGPEFSDLPKLIEEVSRWSVQEYAVALARGDSLGTQDREVVVRKLHQYTGLPADLISRANLRIDSNLFQKNLLISERRLVGRFDGRVTGYALEPTAGWPEYDPSLSQYFPLYSATFNDYVRRQLKFESLLPYEVLSDKVRPWKFGEEGTGYLSVVGELRSAMAKNPHLRVLFASGYYDLATPLLATWYTINHLDLGPLMTNVTERRYPGGHMMYHHPKALADLHEDIVQFIRSAVPEDQHR